MGVARPCSGKTSTTSAVLWPVPSSELLNMAADCTPSSIVSAAHWHPPTRRHAPQPRPSAVPAAARACVV